MTTTPPLLLYRRAGCHLCDEARRILDALLAERAAAGLPRPSVEEVDIEADPLLESRYAFTIPVLEFEGRRLELATRVASIRRFIAAALDASVSGGGGQE